MKIYLLIIFSLASFISAQDIPTSEQINEKTDSIPTAETEVKTTNKKTLETFKSDNTSLLDSNGILLYQDSISSIDTTSSPDSTLIKQQETTRSMDFIDTVIISDTSRFSIFIQAGVQFVDFDDRKRFVEEAAKTKTYMALRGASEEPILVREQDSFEPVNFTLPFYIGASAKLTPSISLSTGVGYYFYTREVSIFSRNEEQGKTFEYSLTAVPVFLEYRHKISESILSINNNRNFNISFRWFWFLENTSITSTNNAFDSKATSQLLADETYTQEQINSFTGTKVLNTNFDPYGNGGGVYLGYEFAQWRGFTLEGDIGVTIVRINGTSPWSSLLPLSQSPTQEQMNDNNFTEENATWNFGGLAMNIKFAYYFGTIESNSTDKAKTMSSGRSSSNGRSSFSR